jgi:hypothetical protein
LRWRFKRSLRDGLLALAWWDWPQDKLGQAVQDMKALTAEAFIAKWRGA